MKGETVTVKSTTRVAKIQAEFAVAESLEGMPPGYVPNERFAYLGLCYNCKRETEDKDLIDCKACGHALFWERTSIDQRKRYLARAGRGWG